MHICKQAESGLGIPSMTRTGENSKAALMIQKVEKRGGGEVIILQVFPASVNILCDFEKINN